MSKKQLSIGNDYERKFCDLLSKEGYWVHNFAHKVSGQPCDVVALKNNQGALIDVKHVEAHKISFTFDRIEPNQDSCFTMAVRYCGIGNCGFAIFFERTQKWKWLPYNKVRTTRENGGNSVKEEDLEDLEEEFW